MTTVQNQHYDDVRPAGFRGQIEDVRIRRDTVPAQVKPLAEAARPQDMDLKAVARWALHYLIENPRKELDYECRFSIMPMDLPPAPTGHDLITMGDTDCRMDWEYIYMRDICGSAEGNDVEQGVRRRILSYLRDDDLAWVPMYHYCIADLKDLEPAVSTWATAKTLLSLAETYQRTHDPQAKSLARKIFVALRGLASWDTGRAYYLGGSGPWRDGQWIPTFVNTIHPAALEPILRYWETTGDAEAFEFAKALADGMLADLQTNQGKDRILADGSFFGHTHCHGHAIWGMAHLGAITHDPRYIEWARRPYEFLLGHGTDWGWVPEGLSETGGNHHSETCTVSDMVSIAAWLARAGYPSYWDHVERYVRNYIGETQFLLTPEIEALYRRLHGDKPQECQQGITVLKELEGGFLACIQPNSLMDTPDGMHMMGCCPPEGMRTLHTAWSNVVLDYPEGVFVNLSFNRDAPEAEVVSFLPYEGRLTVVAKCAKDFFLRPPSWAPRGEVQTYRDGRSVDPVWKGGYVAFKNVHAGEELTITYPLVEFKQTVAVVGKTYTYHWLGNTVVGVEPRAEQMPLFAQVPRSLPPYPSEK